MDNLSALVYRSRAVVPFADIDLYYLLAQARQRNQKLGVTGLMLYDRGFFFQWIEGTNEVLGRVWNIIRADPRHTDIVVLADQQITIQLFAGFGMQFAHRDRQHENIEGFSVADPGLLDDLHLNPAMIPNILAGFSRIGGSTSDVVSAR